jgi:hypothetical protein
MIILTLLGVFRRIDVSPINSLESLPKRAASLGDKEQGVTAANDCDGDLKACRVSHAEIEAHAQRGDSVAAVVGLVKPGYLTDHRDIAFGWTQTKQLHAYLHDEG